MNMNDNLSKFAVAGRIAFRDASPAPVVVLVSPHGAVEISLYGAHVLSYRPTGHSPVLWLADSYKSLEPGKAIRGGIPVCWPWFGAAAMPGLPSHGFARTQEWVVLGTEYDKDETAITLGLPPTQANYRLWPHDFALSLTITLGETLKLELTTENLDKEPFVITEALHTYFRVKDIEKTSVTGLDGQPYTDTTPNGGEKLQSGAVAFDKETDSVYHHHDSVSIITDSGINRRIAIEKDGSNSTVVWNPWIEKAARTADMNDDDWHNFVCVETANTAMRPITIKPGEKHTMTAKYTVLLLGEDGKPLKAEQTQRGSAN
jgi:glucose-6-phosphate 1-epimerase